MTRTKKAVAALAIAIAAILAGDVAGHRVRQAAAAPRLARVEGLR